MNQVSMKRKITDEEIQKLKDFIAETEIIADEELEELRELRKKITQDFYVGMLAVKCYNALDFNVLKFKNETGDFVELLETYLQEIEINRLRSFVSQYSYGEEYGDFIIEANIKYCVQEQRAKYLELIRFFFNIFGGDS
jgi:hypothetical protein